MLCETCDSFACMVDAKGDADVAAVRPALRAESKNVRLLTNAEVIRRFLPRAIAVECDEGGPGTVRVGA